MRATPLLPVLSALALVAGCMPHGAIRPADTGVDKLFAENRFASAFMAPNLATESNTVVLDLEGGLEFVPQKGEFFKPITDDPAAEVRRQVAAEGQIFALTDGTNLLGYMVKKDKPIPFGRQQVYYVFIDPQARTWTVRGHAWDASDGKGEVGGR